MGRSGWRVKIAGAFAHRRMSRAPTSPAAPPPPRQTTPSIMKAAPTRAPAMMNAPLDTPMAWPLHASAVRASLQSFSTRTFRP